jgi:hypothetical protein
VIKVYKYGLLAPTTGEAIFDEQCRLARLSALARLRAYEDYRRACDALRAKLSAVCAEQAEIRRQIAEDRAVLRGMKTGRGAPDSDEAAMLKTRIKMASQRAKELAPLAKAERERLKSDRQLQALDNGLRAEYLNQAHAFSAAGLFWGNRQLVEEAHNQRAKAMDLRFPREWNVARIQIQGGMPPSKLATDGRCSLTAALPVPGRAGKPRPRLRLRIGRDDGIAEWPIVLHRPIPPDASIRFVKVTRRTIGRETKWDAHFTVHLPDPEPVGASKPMRLVAVRPTFAHVGGEIVVAESLDTAGLSSPEALHPEVSGALERVRGLRAVRDKERDTLLAEIAARRAKGEAMPPILPQSIARWESCDRLRGFILETWVRAAVESEANRGDLLDLALRWADHDRHLWDWERHAAETAIARRTHLYRCRAAQLADAYDGLVVPSVNYGQMAQRRARPEQDRELSKQASRQRMLAAPGLLRSLLVQAFQSRGKCVVEVPSNGGPAELLALVPTGKEKTPEIRAAKFAKRHRAKVKGRVASTRIPVNPL